MITDPFKNCVFSMTHQITKRKRCSQKKLEPAGMNKSWSAEISFTGRQSLAIFHFSECHSAKEFGVDLRKYSK